MANSTPKFAPTHAPHPFDPLSAAEISQAASIVRTAYPNGSPYFRVITLCEPRKQEMLAYLDHSSSSVQRPRLATVQLDLNGVFSSLTVSLTSSSILSHTPLPGRHPHVDAAAMQRAEIACLADQRVQDALHAMDLPEDATVCVEPWTYATDGTENEVLQGGKISMCYFYLRLSPHPDANFYAYPLELCAELTGDLRVLRVYCLPTSSSLSSDLKTCQPKPFDRRRIHQTSEYHPDLLPPSTPHRTSTKPYTVSQPHGPSFSFAGNTISWEGFTFHIGFNYREGLVLHDIRHSGRQLFYRLSLSEMFVPYADPRCPYTRKAAFDLGNDGAGVNANSLRLGCDCLGCIQYLSFYHTTSAGEPLALRDVVCVHEIDDGILWKHTNHRTGNPVVTRARVLVVQTVITVSNYEYIFAFHFGLDASIHYEVRATGILSTAPIEVGAPAPAYGTIVAPGVMAPFHQHLFCLRIDPCVDGAKNSLVVEESVPMPLDDEHPDGHNPFAVGYTTVSKTVESETGLDLDHTTNRTFKIVNENATNSITGTPVAYKLVPYYSQLLLAHPSSYHAKRSEFAAHSLWVTRYQDGELYASGQHTMQSLGGEGIASWIQQRTNQPSTSKSAHTSTQEDSTTSSNSVRDADIVLWHTFGSTHNPTSEHWPVMPCEKMVVGLKPVNFFARNPGIDVAVSDHGVNKSVLVDGDHGDTLTNGTACNGCE